MKEDDFDRAAKGNTRAQLRVTIRSMANHQKCLSVLLKKEHPELAASTRRMANAAIDLANYDELEVKELDKQKADGERNTPRPAGDGSGSEG